ncbi:baseplate J/gp47 family protein [Grimontia sp. SpTr1]|uniref:baseplate assembly protein n=1 Tax=Grimontia sp. SpTr1 TaxID=2995319 RepID=UPI00248B2B20|nr:baseplate J/gp47 family protein [Grimontia sp. SpTr1]
MSSVINLAELPSPNVVEALDYEAILTEMLADLKRRAPAFSATVESDPAYKILEVAAYREMLLRQRVNDAARAVMVAYAKDNDLEHLGALFNVPRRVIQQGDAEASPPVPDINEDDEIYRVRIPLSLEGLSTAGPVGAYQYHSLSASGQVKDVDVQSPSPGEVLVTVLSQDGQGEASLALLGTVSDALNDEDVRPLTDKVTVQGAEVVTYTVHARLTFFEGPDLQVAMAAAEQAVREYITREHRLGRHINRSGLFAALHQPGVKNVQLLSPADDLVVARHQAAWCETLSLEVKDE